MCTALRTLFPCTRESYANQSTKKEKLVCESGCDGCPALHRWAGPVAPRDNHSLAEATCCALMLVWQNPFPS